MSRATFFCFSLLTAISVSLTATAAFAEKCDVRGAAAEITVMAPPDIAYEAIRAIREEDPSGCKIISTTDKESIVEEYFDGLPIIGSASCIYRETYDPQRVSYKMISSDKLKAFEGEWTLTPTDDGQHTLVRLRNYIDTGLKIPFARKITDMASTNEIKQHLADMKKSAEQRLKRVARAKNQST